MSWLNYLFNRQNHCPLSTSSHSSFSARSCLLTFFFPLPWGAQYLLTVPGFLPPGALDIFLSSTPTTSGDAGPGSNSSIHVDVVTVVNGSRQYLALSTATQRVYLGGPSGENIFLVESQSTIIDIMCSTFEHCGALQIPTKIHRYQSMAQNWADNTTESATEILKNADS